MTNKELEVIDQFKDLLNQKLITRHEYDWCVGAIRNRHNLTRETRHQLRDSVKEILKKSLTRMPGE